jgi:citrate lyase subunit beta/citryl-CoA lyase
VTRLAFGALDLAAELGVDPAAAEPVLGHARAVLVLSSAAGGLPAPIDGVTTAVHDHDALSADLRRSRSTGFGGKLAVHPAQVAAINDAYSPSPAELAWAADVLAAVQTSEGVTTVDGVMVDAPVILRARRLLTRALPQEPNNP